MSSAEVRYGVARFEARVIVGLHGELDFANAPDFERDVLATFIPPIQGVVLDLAYCTFIDSSGSSALVRVRDRAAELGLEFRLTSIPRTLKAGLGASGLTEALG